MKYHVYHCKLCRAPLQMYLDHVGATEPWSPERGCGAGCEGSFRHPRGKCSRAGLTVRHEGAYLELSDRPPP